MLFYCSEHMQKRESNICELDTCSFLRFSLPTNTEPYNDRGFVPGTGVMTAAVARAAEWVFANTPIIRIFAAAYVSNPASQRVLDKAGFRFVGTMHRAFVGNGAFVDGCYYELLK